METPLTCGNDVSVMRLLSLSDQPDSDTDVAVPASVVDVRWRAVAKLLAKAPQPRSSALSPVSRLTKRS